MVAMTQKRETITLRMPLERCEIADGEVRFRMSLEAARGWIPALQAQVDGLEQVEALEVRGEG